MQLGRRRPSSDGIVSSPVPCRLPPISELVRYASFSGCPQFRRGNIDNKPASDGRDARYLDLQVSQRSNVRTRHVPSSTRHGIDAVSSTKLKLSLIQKSE
jgi:hypothetical protein